MRIYSSFTAKSQAKFGWLSCTRISTQGSSHVQNLVEYVQMRISIRSFVNTGFYPLQHTMQHGWTWMMRQLTGCFFMNLLINLIMFSILPVTTWVISWPPISTCIRSLSPICCVEWEENDYWKCNLQCFCWIDLIEFNVPFQCSVGNIKTSGIVGYSVDSI